MNTPIAETLCVIRVFSDFYKAETAPEFTQTIFRALRAEISTLLESMGGGILDCEGNGLLAQFKSDPKKREDVFKACKAAPVLLRQFSLFRQSRPPEEQSYYHFALSIVALPTEGMDVDVSREQALSWAALLAGITQPEQILIDQISFQELVRQLPLDWQKGESQEDYGERSQQFYTKSNPATPLPESLSKKMLCV